MFGIVRIIAGILIGRILLVFLYRYKKVNRWVKMGTVAFAVAFITVAAFIPVENVFYRFKSAEEVYKYYYSGNPRTEVVIEGTHSDFVVGVHNDTRTYLIVPKTADGWKLATGKDTRRIVRHISDGIVTYVYQYKDTGDYFITILDTNGSPLELSDDNNTNFYALTEENALGKEFVTYYAYIPDWTTQYHLTINGNQIEWNHP